MSTLIAMCCYDTEENKRTEYTELTLRKLERSVNYSVNPVYIVDNGSCDATKKILEDYSEVFKIITLSANIGTAKGINKAWRYRKEGQNAIKMDNDVVIHSDHWLEDMEEAIAREPKIGIVGLKRNDLAEYPGHEIAWYNSKLYFLPHIPGQTWIPFEEVINLMGTCTMFNSALLDIIGYLNQPGIYGFDDSLASLRARMAGFKVGFLPHIRIDHIDRGNNPYIQEKQSMAAVDMPAFEALCQKYYKKEIPLFHKDED